MTETKDTRADLIMQAQKAVQAGEFARGQGIAEQVLKDSPKDQDALYIAAVCSRYQKQDDDALGYLSRLKNAIPDFGRAYQEEGHLRHAQGRYDDALKAYAHATRCNPALIASWTKQAQILTRLGKPQEAAQAEAQAARIVALPKPLLAVTNHLHEGRIFKAEEIVRAYLLKRPKDTEAMRLLADIGSRLGVHEDADILLESAIELAPDNLQLRIDYIQVLRKRQKFAAALEQARKLLAFDPESPVFQSLFAIECMQSGDYETALAMFDTVLAKIPGDPATLTSRGHALKTYGQTALAVESYKGAIAADPQHGDAWYALANLKTYRFSEAELEALRHIADTPDLSFMSRIHISFALAKALEDRKHFDEAFNFFAQGNALKRQQTRYTTQQMQEEFNAQKRYCTAQMLDAQAGKGLHDPAPIFIVGLPRAGSTLIEQILASHSQVDGTLELPNILSLAHRLRGRQQVTDRDRYPRILGELTGSQLQALGQSYIDDTRIHRKGAPFFTDKMPNNFRHIGLIHLILPTAKIIDARRDPMDCCWSGFKQLFAEGQEFTYGLDDIGAYYKAYVDLMSHWDSVLPKGRILKVQHENVLDDVEGEVARILDYCELPFESACVDFHETDRAVRTASSEQVRQPLNRKGQGQWKPYEAHLDPLKQALGDLI